MTVATLYELFGTTADRHPGVPAIEVDGRSFTYRELAQLAEAAARLMVGAFGGVPATVAVLVSRTVTGYACYLGAQRLGATVLPLDSEHPVTRNVAVANLAAADVICADQHGAGQLDALREAGAAGLDLSDADWHRRPATPLPWVRHQTGPDRLAYVIFTSGSTGEPKGVPIRHRNVLPHLAYNIARYQVGPGSRWAQNGELAFDLSVLELFVAWGGGGTLVVPRREELFSPVRFINDRRITHWHSVPSAVSFARRPRSLTPGAMPELRWTLFGAEQLTTVQALAWQAAAPGSRIDNVYGPTELAITCAAYRLPDNPSRWPDTSNGTVPIGRVYPHLEAIVLDDQGMAAEDGELCVRGPQRFDGYLNSVDNLGRFVAYERGGAEVREADGPIPADRWYRTGDRVRIEDTRLVHHGRLDQQLKVRGHRVEPGEIEAVLRAHPGVAEVVVVPVTAADSETDLVAVYTGTPAADRDFADHLLSRLPAYMLPRRYRWTDRLPLTTNGKIDRRGLAESCSANGSNSNS